MQTQALISGLLSILTPGVLLMTVFIITSFSNSKIPFNKILIYVIGFGIMVFGLYLVYGYLFTNHLLDFNMIQGASSIWRVILLLQLIFGLALFGVIRIKLDNSLKGWINNLLILLLFSLLFTLSTFTSAGQLLSVILISNMHHDSNMLYIFPIIGFSFGLIISTGLLIIFSLKILLKHKDKRWLRISQLIIGSLFLITVIIGQITRSNVA